MSRRIALLVAAMASAIVLVFLLPLGFLVRSLAYDRGTAVADQEARNVAILVSSLRGSPDLDDVVAAVDARTPASTVVVLADGEVVGTAPISAEDPDVVRARAGEAFNRRTADGGLRILVPVVTADGTDVVLTRMTEEQLDEGVHAAWVTLAVLGVSLIGLAAAIAARAARRIAMPVREVAEVADRMRDGDLDARAHVQGTEETEALAEALNRLGARIQELLIAERGVAGDLAHRLRTPVTALRIDLDRVTEQDLGDRLRDHVATLQRTVDLIVEDARRPVRNTMQARCDALGVLRDRFAFWAPLAEDQDRSFESRLPANGASAEVGLDSRDLADLVDVLIDNVFAHTPEGVPFEAHAAIDGNDLRVTIRDAGGWQTPGTSGAGHTGLGLQLVRRLAEAADGRIEVHGEAAGTTVTVTLPLRP